MPYLTDSELSHGGEEGVIMCSWSDDVLAYDPFEGDFGEPRDRTLKDKIVKALKHGACHMCGGTIAPGEITRSRADIFDGELMSFRWCNECCNAMAKSWTDNGESLEKRSGLLKLCHT